MKRFKLSILFFVISLSVSFAQQKHKTKTLDHYYVSNTGTVVTPDIAEYEVKIVDEGDSIRVITSYIDSDWLLSFETYTVYTDAQKIKCGTQAFYGDLNQLRHLQFIDCAHSRQEIRNFNEQGHITSATVIDDAKGETLDLSYYENGQVKAQNLTIRSPKKDIRIIAKSFHQNGNLLKESYSTNGVTDSLKIYQSTGELCLSIPCHDNDTIFINSKDKACVRKEAERYGVVKLDNDSIKINLFRNDGRKLAVENYMTYSPENSIIWGNQSYYFTTTPEPTDSISTFMAVNGDKLKELRYYPDGKIMSETTTTYDAVMLPIKELRQYYPSGVLHRYQKMKYKKLIEGHLYDENGKEITPYQVFDYDD